MARDTGRRGGLASSPLALGIDGTRYVLERRWDADPITFRTDQPIDPAFYDGREDLDLGSTVDDPGRWVDWVLHVRWSFKEEDRGLLELWRDGRRLVQRAGPNCYNDRVGIFLRFGMYKWPWRFDRRERPSTVDSRVVYHDEHRIGGSEASYEAVSPP